jgi:putative endonuclease
MRKEYRFWTYIVTDYNRNVMYTGVTNNLAQRLKEHYDNRGDDKSFAGQYYCYNLVYYEFSTYILNAIQREKEIKDLSRARKMALITLANPTWEFWNVEVCGAWPPEFEGRFLLNDKKILHNKEILNDKETDNENDDTWWNSLTPPPDGFIL